MTWRKSFSVIPRCVPRKIMRCNTLGMHSEVTPPLLCCAGSFSFKYPCNSPFKWPDGGAATHKSSGWRESCFKALSDRDGFGRVTVATGEEEHKQQANSERISGTPYGNENMASNPLLLNPTTYLRGEKLKRCTLREQRLRRGREYIHI